MASSGSTKHLNLNQWQGSDKPKMEDFNSDNQKIDQQLGLHLMDAQVHLNETQRQDWNRAVPVIGTYTGDGKNTQKIELGFRPSFGIVFAVNEPPMRISGNTGILYSAMMGPDGTSAGLCLEDDGFLAIYIPNLMDDRITHLNFKDTVYQYIVFH